MANRVKVTVNGAVVLEREGAAGPVGGDLLQVGQAAVEPYLRREIGCGGPPQTRMDADLRAAHHVSRVAGEREVPRGDHPRGELERPHHAGGLPQHRVRGRLQLRGRAGVGECVCGDHPVQQGAEGAVRRVLRPSGHLLAGHLQWLPAEFRGRASRSPSCRASSTTRHWVNVRVKSNAILLQGMEGSTLGVWAIHNDASVPMLP